MATRKCGRVTIRCSLVPAPGMPHGEQYKCVLSVGGVVRSTQYVGLPAHLSHAIDSPRAYSDAAHAAVTFALDEGKLSDSDVDFTDSGYRLQRPKRRSR